MTLLFDTSILVYAVGDPSHPLATPCRELVTRASERAAFATTTPEVLQEFMHVRARRRDRRDARDLVGSFATVLTPLISTNEEDLSLAADIFAATPAIGAFDSMLAALVMRRDGLQLASADLAFSDVSGIEPYLVRPGA